MNPAEEKALRELAAGQCVIPAVTSALGPMSLWSKSAFEAELKKARAEERQHIIAICDELANKYESMTPPMHALANVIDEVVATIQDRRQNT